MVFGSRDGNKLLVGTFYNFVNSPRSDICDTTGKDSPLDGDESSKVYVTELTAVYPTNKIEQ